MRLCIQTKVAGVSFRRENVAASAEYDSILLVPEPNNQYDPNAIAIYNVAKHLSEPLHIGYIPAKRCEPFHRFLKILDAMGLNPDAHGMIDSLTPPEGKSPGAIKIGIRINFDAMAVWVFETFNVETVIDETVVTEKPGP